jgi:hypothetical protein
VSKVPALSEPERVVLDIGPGCSELPTLLVDVATGHRTRTIWMDSEEMLAQLPEREDVTKIAGRFPDCPALFEEYAGRIDGIVAYSVLHHVFAEGNAWGFVDAAMELLAHGATMLIGDLPNVSKRKRFLSSPAGIAFHHEFTGSDEAPDVRFNTPEPGRIDDAVVIGLIARCRAAGCDAYVVPQPPELPLANRREDLIVYRP